MTIYRIVKRSLTVLVIGLLLAFLVIIVMGMVSGLWRGIQTTGTAGQAIATIATSTELR